MAESKLTNQVREYNWKLHDQNLLKVRSWETENGNEIDIELDNVINRLRLIEGAFFELKDGRKSLKWLDDDAFNGLGLLLADATTGAILLRRAIWGDQTTRQEEPSDKISQPPLQPTEQQACPPLGKGIPDVSCELSMAIDKLEFVLGVGFETGVDIADIGPRVMSGMVSTLYGIKWELTEVFNKLYPGTGLYPCHDGAPRGKLADQMEGASELKPDYPTHEREPQTSARISSKFANGHGEDVLDRLSHLENKLLALSCLDFQTAYSDRIASGIDFLLTGLAEEVREIFSELWQEEIARRKAIN